MNASILPLVNDDSATITGQQSGSALVGSPAAPVVNSSTIEPAADCSGEGNDAFSFPPRARSQSLRRQSISLNAVINHRRALIGALITGVGSNISLPSCVLAQDRDIAGLVDNNAASTEQRTPLLLQLIPMSNRLPATNKKLGEVENATCNNATDETSRSAIIAGSGDHKRQHREEQRRRRSLRQQRAELMSSISTLYAKLLVVVGVAVPVTASVSQQVPAALDKGFYLYLYLGSVAFVVAMYTTLLRDKAIERVMEKHAKHEELRLPASAATASGGGQLSLSHGALHNKGCAHCACCSCGGPTAISGGGGGGSGSPVIVHGRHRVAKSRERLRHPRPTQQYGSFCLRLGSVGFGASSLVFTGLQISAEVGSSAATGAIVPAARLLLVTAQMHFIFLNSKDVEMRRRASVAKLGLMHLIATNVCEWLQALIEETQYEIFQLEHANNYDSMDNGVHRKLLHDASPFLFPCTIEFNLICAVILFEMWKWVDRRGHLEDSAATTGGRSVHQFSIDCGSAHKGLFGGILVVAATVLSLIMFFVLREPEPKLAVEQVTVLELAIHVSGTLAAIFGALKLRSLEYRDAKPPHLDATLLAAAQTGIYLHTFFGVVGSVLTRGPTWIVCLTADSLALVQSTAQTILIKVAWKRRARSSDAKPGKELVTFLIVVNIAMWTVNTLEKSRAGVRPDHLKFFGVWAWTIITHVSMPLAIFYRFHSAICLFEVWKSCYKFRPPLAAAAAAAAETNSTDSCGP